MPDSTLIEPSHPDTDPGGPLPPVFPPPDGDFGGDPGRPDRGGGRSTSLLGIGVVMCASTMTFTALVSAMVVRRGLGNDWHRVPLPAILWWNTAALIVSSIVFDAARRVLRRNRRSAFNRLWTLGTILGTWFLIGQCFAWKDLSAHGFFLHGNSASAFFYVLTWSHAAHVVFNLLAVYYVEYRALRFQLSPVRRTTVEVSTVFWHFLDVMWLGLMALFAWWA